MKPSYIPGQGLPVALPLGSSEPESSAQVSGLSRKIRGTNTPRPSAAEVSAQRLSQRALAMLDELMPERDRRVLELVGEHRYLTTLQLQRFVFTDLAPEFRCRAATAQRWRHLPQPRTIPALPRPLPSGRRCPPGSTRPCWGWCIGS